MGPAWRLGMHIALSGAIAVVAFGCGTSTSVRRSELPIEDDFSGDCEWSQDKDEHISLGCEKGEYRVVYRSARERITHFIPRRLEERFTAAHVEADMTLRAFPRDARDAFEFHGLMCVASRPNAPAQGYIFAVGAVRKGFAILRNDETDERIREQFYLRPLVDEGSEAVAGIGKTTRVAGECRATKQGVDLAMYVDGEQVATTRDPNGFRTFEGFAFITASSATGADIRFDNFKAEEIAGSR